MKTSILLKQLLLITFIGSFTVYQSCIEDPNAEGEVRFSFEVVDVTENPGGRTKADVPTTVVLSIEDIDGNPIYTLERFPIFEFNGSFLTEPISLTIGDYRITDYLVLDDIEETIFATPVEGSNLAYLVDDPLPIEFTITEDATTQLAPQVVSTEEFTPADFGYADTKFTIIPTFDFLLSVLAFDVVTEGFDLTTGEVTISGDGEVIYTNTFNAVTNQIKLEDGFTNYALTVSRSGFTSVDTTLSNADLQANFDSPLVITLYPFENTSSLEFDGVNQTVEVPGVDNFSFVQNTRVFSLEAWIKLDDFTRDQVIFGNSGTTGEKGFALFFNASNQTIRASGYFGSLTNNVFQSSTDPNILPDNEWHHIAFTDNGTSTQFYFDGLPVNTNEAGSSGLSSGPATRNLRIGDGNFGSFWNGQIDEVRIWNITRTASQILEFSSQELTGSETGLVFYLNLNDGTGSSTASDLASGFDGTLINMDVNTAWRSDTPF
jgi:hypothetical protein